MGPIITWFILLVLSVPSAVPGRRISCASSESVHEGQSAVITCDYHVNLRNDRRGFYIYKYSFGGKDPDLPAICDWDDDFIRCDVQPGYDVIVHGHKMLLNISSAHEAHAGRYVCHVLQPEDDIQSDECNLTIQKKENSTKVKCHAITYPHQEQPVTVMCFVPQSLGAADVVLERHEPSDTSATVEIIRCNSKTDECRTRTFGYQLNVEESSSTGFKVLVVTVERAGRYICKAEGKHMQTQTCDLMIDKDSKTETVKVSSSQHPEVHTIVILVLAPVFLISGYCSIVYLLKRLNVNNHNSNNGASQTKDEEGTSRDAERES